MSTNYWHRITDRKFASSKNTYNSAKIKVDSHVVQTKESTSSLKKKRPEGPLSGNNASLAGHSAPSSMVKKPT